MAKSKKTLKSMHPLPSLVESMRTLSGDSRFLVFIEEIANMRENAILDLCNDAVVENSNKMLATIGEIRSFSTILSLASNYRQKVVDSGEVTDNPEGTA